MKRRSHAGRAFGSRTLRLGLLLTVVLLGAGCLHRFNAEVHARRASASAAADAAAGALAKAEAAHARCRAAKAETLEKEGERWHQRQIKVEAELKTCVCPIRSSSAATHRTRHPPPMTPLPARAGSRGLALLPKPYRGKRAGLGLSYAARRVQGWRMHCWIRRPQTKHQAHTEHRSAQRCFSVPTHLVCV
jgi:hypothetical protein